VLFFKMSALWDQKAVYKVFDLCNLLNCISRPVAVLPCKLCYGHSPQCFYGLRNQIPACPIAGGQRLPTVLNLSFLSYDG